MNRKYWILIGGLLSPFAGNLELVMPNAALNTILNELQISSSTDTWILSIFSLLFATTMPIFGKLGDMIDHKRLYLSSLVAFSVSLLFCGMADSAGELIFWIAVEGIAIARRFLLS